MPTREEARALRRFDPGMARCILGLGGPIALQILAEIGAFSVGAVMSGRLGALSSAGHQLAITLALAHQVGDRGDLVVDRVFHSDGQVSAFPGSTAVISRGPFDRTSNFYVSSTTGSISPWKK